MRILALAFPHLPTDRIRRAELGLSWRSSGGGEGAEPPLALFERIGNADRLACVCEAAWREGLRPGLGLAEARARFPRFDFRRKDAKADALLLEAVADWCDRYTPLIALDAPNGLVLDITGCAHLFGGEGALLNDLLSRLFALGLAAQGAIAAQPGTALALAPHGRNATLVASGAEAEAVAPLAVEALRLEAELAPALRRLGLKTVRDLLALPRESLVRRFGEAAGERLDEATGRRGRPIVPRRPISALIAERRFAEPVALQEDVERVLLFLASRLEGDLRRRGQGGRRFEMSLFRVDGAVERVAVGTVAPLRDPDRVARLFRDRLAGLGRDLEAGFGYDLIRLAVPVAEDMPDRQASLAGEMQNGEALATLLDRLSARLGERSVTALVPRASHWPERAERIVDAVRASAPEGRTGEGGTEAHAARTPLRPTRLLDRPEPVATTYLLPEGPPLQFRWRRALHTVAGYEGPERIGAEWWRDGDAICPRDYYRVEDDRGRRYWLFRQKGAEERQPDWFIHGLFA